MAEGVLGAIEGLYYFFEDKYYEILDKVNETVPVYPVIDTIDRYFPSFVLFLILGLLLLLLFASYPLGYDPVGALLSLLGLGGGPAKVRVVDISGTGIGSAMVGFSAPDGRKETKTTDAFGELQTNFFGKGIRVSVSQKGFADFNDTIDIGPAKLYTITLKRGVGGTKKLEYRLLGEDGGLIPSDTPVSMEFTCSSGLAPQNISRRGGTQTVFSQTGCGTLTASISAPGFEDATKSVDVGLQQQPIEVTLFTKKQYGAVKVRVFDADTSAPISDVQLMLKNGDRGVLRLGSTDSTGAALAQHLPAGSYYVEATPPDASGYPSGRSDDFDIGIADFSGGPKDVAVPLRKLSDSKKIFLKFVDSNDSSAVKGVKADLIIDGVASAQARDSGDDGTVQFANMDSAKTYAVIASHPQYVLKVLQNLTLVSSSETNPTVVSLDKAVASGARANSGSASVAVSDSLGAAVSGAHTWLYSSLYTFPLNGALPSETGQDGTVLYNNLPPDNYRAKAQKLIGNLTYNGDSPAKDLVAGQTIQLPVQLVTANGYLQASVLDHDTRSPLADANVSFIDSSNGQTLAVERTSAQGLTDPVEFKADKKVYLLVKKDGYYSTASVRYGIIPNATTTAEVTLDKVGSPRYSGDFDVVFGDVYNTNGMRAQRLDAGSQYLFRFKVHVARKAENVRTIVRLGLDSERNAQDGNILLNSVTPSQFISQVVYSKCFNSNDIYSDCPPLDPTGGAKQAVSSFGTLDPSSGMPQDYEFEVTALVRQGTKDGTPIEIHYGGRASLGPVESFVTSPSELKLVRFLSERNFCNPDCGLRFEAAYYDSARTLLPAPANANLSLGNAKWISGGPFQLAKGTDYLVDFNIYNDTAENFSNVKMQVTNDNLPPDKAALTITDTQVQLGNLAAAGKFSGTVRFTAAKAASVTGLDMNLGLNRKGDSSTLNFMVMEAPVPTQLKVSLTPQSLEAHRNTVSFDVTVTDAAGANVQGADIFVYDHADAQQVITLNPARTDASGKATLTLHRIGGFSGSTLLDVNASKAGYIEGTAQLTFSPAMLAPFPGIDCITDETGLPLDSKYVSINQQGGSNTFVVKNNGCGKSLDLSFSTAAQKSDLGISYNNQDLLSGTQVVHLNSGESAQIIVKAGNVLGIQPVFVKTQLQLPNSNSTQEFSAGTVRVIVTNPLAQVKKTSPRDACLSVARPAASVSAPQDAFTFDFTSKASDKLSIVNTCYSGETDSAESSNTQADRMPQTTLPQGIVSESTVYTQDLAASRSEQILNLTRTGQTERFFIISRQDYVNGGN